MAAILLSFFIPFFIMFQTKTLSAIKRLFYYGTGLILYAILVLTIVEFPICITNGLIPSISIVLAVLFYGDFIFYWK